MCQCSSLVTNIIPLCLFEPSVLFDLRNLRNAPHGAQQNFNKEPNKAKQLCYFLHQAPVISLIPQPWIRCQQKHSTTKGKGMLHILRYRHWEYWLFLNRSQSQSSGVDGPPSTCRRSWSPSDTTHNVESWSTKDTKKDQHLESRVAAIEISKPDSSEKKNNWTAQRVSSTSWIHQTLEYMFWGYVYPPYLFMSHARGGFFG